MLFDFASEEEIPRGSALLFSASDDQRALPIARAIRAGWRAFLPLLLAGSLLVSTTGCQSQAAAQGAQVDANSAQAEPSATPSGPGNEKAANSAEAAAISDEAGPAGESPGEDQLEDGRTSAGAQPFPELSVRSIGMHIGGGENTAAEKRPFLEDLEQATSALLRCQRLASDPRQAGVVGVDLFIPPAGGAPEVKAVRQKLGATDYSDCIVDAFLGVNFRAARQATILSYSVRFSWSE